MQTTWFIFANLAEAERRSDSDSNLQLAAKKDHLQLPFLKLQVFYWRVCSWEKFANLANARVAVQQFLGVAERRFLFGQFDALIALMRYAKFNAECARICHGCCCPAQPRSFLCFADAYRLIRLPCEDFFSAVNNQITTGGSSSYPLISVIDNCHDMALRKRVCANTTSCGR